MNERVTDLIEEMEGILNKVTYSLYYLKQLKAAGVEYVDEEGEPVVPDNVLMFPQHRTMQ